LGIALLEQAQNPELNQSLVEISMPLLEQAVQTWPEDLSSWDAKAVALAHLGRPQEALEICEMILNKAPKREVTLLNAALFTKALGRAETAISYWQRILDINPWSVEYRVELAKLYAQRKEWSKTLAECQRILRQYPASLDARLLLIDYYVHHGDRDHARAEFDRVMTLNPPRPEWLRGWFDAQMR